MTYFGELCLAMQMVAEYPGTIFMGQAVAWPGTGMTRSFDKVPREKLLELPVAEDMQMGMATGMSLAGFLPVCVYPRWNFLLMAAGQLVLHLDKLPLYSGYIPRVIIRTAVATPIPLHPGPQHLGDFTEAFRSILKTVEVVSLERPKQIMPAYSKALVRSGSTILVEHTEMYEDIA